MEMNVLKTIKNYIKLWKKQKLTKKDSLIYLSGKESKSDIKNKNDDIINKIIMLNHYKFLNILLISKMNQIEQRLNIVIMMMNQNLIFIKDLIISFFLKDITQKESNL